MKVSIECAPCIIERGYREIIRSTQDITTQFRAMEELLQLMSTHFKPGMIPARIGTERDRLIHRITGVDDPYAEDKHRSNALALKLLPKIEEFILNFKPGYERFRKACIASVVGNLIEFDVSGHVFVPEKLVDLIQNTTLAIDRTREIYKLLQKSKLVLFLTDNAGEIAFDTILVKEIRQLGPKVTVAVKSSPILDDALLSDAYEVGMDKVADKIITTGSNSVGLFLEEVSAEFREYWQDSDLILAKGMGYYETLTEINLKKPTGNLLTAKCNPIAQSLGVKKESHLALILS
ncbi:DUF89 family protein [Candidatus Bathyarchaeota archaeon]|nr:DUF89 family protein [Candidatus Bathyarchaeota archaeon]